MTPRNRHAGKDAATPNAWRLLVATCLLLSVFLLRSGPSLAQGGCNVPITPSFTEYYGDLTLDGQAAPIGALVEAFNTQGVRTGCFVVGIPGIYGYLRVYGADPDTGTPGMAQNEAVTLKVNGAIASLTPAPVLWIGDRSYHNVALSALSPPAGFGIGRTTGGVSLHWNVGGGVNRYEVWRGLTPYFTPGSADTALIGDGASGNCSQVGGAITCTDASAIGNPNINTFYFVRAFNAGGAYADSSRCGEFDFTLTPGSQ